MTFLLKTADFWDTTPKTNAHIIHYINIIHKSIDIFNTLLSKKQYSFYLQKNNRHILMSPNIGKQNHNTPLIL